MRKLLIFISLLLFIALSAFYAAAYPSHFLWQEQNQIFLDSRDWLATYFDAPAWLGCLAGDWLTRFYIYPVAGPLILSMTITLCAVLFAVEASILLPHGRNGSIAASVLTLLFTALLIFCSFPSSSTLSFFICILGGLAMALPCLPIPEVSRRAYALSPLLVPLSYWLFGFGSLLTAVFIVLFFVERRKWTVVICAVVFAVGFPVILNKNSSLPYSNQLLYPKITVPSLPEWKLEHRLAIADAFYFRDFDKAAKLALDVDNPDDFTAFYYYLSSAVRDSLPDNLLKYPVRSLGTLTTIGDKTPLPVINMMNDLYFELGDMTYAERAAMMRNVFSPRNRNVRMMQRLAETNLVSGDTLAALKYLRILSGTHAYSEWSGLHTPGSMSPKVEMELARRRNNSNSKDNIRLGDNARNIILELLESNPGNTVALDYLLCTDLLLKDMDTFKMDYDTYCIQKGSPRYKDLYQQALMIYLAGTDAPREEWERYVVSGPQLQRFNQYSARRGSPAFADTYWYYFDKE